MRNRSLREFLSPDEWLVVEDEFDVEKINFYETIFTLGNGYLGSRGSLEDGHTAAFPQTFLNGLFDHNDATVTHMVTVPDWALFTVFANHERLSLQNCKSILAYQRILDLKQGLLYRLTRYQDPSGNITRYESIRFTNFSNKHLCELHVAITPENYSGEIVIESAINGHMYNLDRIPAYPHPKKFDPEVKWEKWAKSKHLSHIISKPLGKNYLYLEMKTLDRPHRLGYCSALNILNHKAEIYGMCDYEQTKHIATIKAKAGKTIYAEKLVSIYSSRDVDRTKVEQSSYNNLLTTLQSSFIERFTAHKKVWHNKWHDSDCIIEGDPKANNATRFCIYHLLIAANEDDPRTNVGAKSMSGEGYKGHIFWDTEIFTLPFFIYTQPETAKSLIMYRYNTLQGAKENAAATGHLGARYPWESADFGHEETPSWSADGKNRIWPGEEEIHITADVVRGLFTYFNATDDLDFMLNYGAEIVFETARFWASRLEHNKEHDRYELTSVIGPDEFHEHINNNVFTNYMAKWNLQKAVETFHWLQQQHIEVFNTLTTKLELKPTEVELWKEIAKKVHILYNPETKLFEEFEGYYQLRDVAITEFDEQNMPLFPKGLNDFNCGGSMLIKQADVIALLYVLADEFDDEVKKTNYDFYEQRTIHSSSLSTSIHAIMAIATRNVTKALRYFHHTAYMDITDQKGSTETGMHIAATGGTWQCIVAGFGGMRVKNKKLTFKPWLPLNWQAIRFKIKWHGNSLQVCVRHSEVNFYWDGKEGETLAIEVMDKPLILHPQETISFSFEPETTEIKV